MSRKKSVRAALIATLAIVGITAAPSTVLAASADLSITKADSADPVSTGSELIYTLTVANAGPDTANGVEVVDELPNQLDFVSATASQGSCERTGKRITCALGALATGATATVTIRVIPKKEGQLSNTATVTTTDTDSNAENNSDTEVTTVAGE